MHTNVISCMLISFIQNQIDDKDEVSRATICLPIYFSSRWCKLVKYQQERYAYDVTTALRSANISKKEFSKCWQFVRSRTRPEEVFSWFKDAGFGQGYMKTYIRASLTVTFVRKILQRYKDIKVPTIFPVVYLRFSRFFAFCLFMHISSSWRGVNAFLSKKGYISLPFPTLAIHHHHHHHHFTPQKIIVITSLLFTTTVAVHLHRPTMRSDALRCTDTHSWSSSTLDNVLQMLSNNTKTMRT